MLDVEGDINTADEEGVVQPWRFRTRVFGE